MNFAVPLGGWGTEFHNLNDEQKDLLANYCLLWVFFESNLLKLGSSFDAIKWLVNQCPNTRIEVEFVNQYWIKEKFKLFKERFLDTRKRYSTLYFSIYYTDHATENFLNDIFHSDNPNPFDQVITLTLIAASLRDYLTKTSDLEFRVQQGVFLEDINEILRRLYNLLNPKCYLDE